MGRELNDPVFKPGARVLYKSFMETEWRGPATVIAAYERKIRYYCEWIDVQHYRVKLEVTGGEVEIDVTSDDIRLASLLEEIARVSWDPDLDG